MSEIQSVIFNRDVFGYEDALEWLEDHNLFPIKDGRFTKNEIRFRIRDPKEFSKFRIIHFTPNIEAVLGFNE
jgi:hypothetical protein